MDLSEPKHLPVPGQPVAVFSPHPLQPALNRELVYAYFQPRETIGQYLVRTGLLARMRGQPFRLEISGAYVPRNLWHCTRPKPGALINLHAAVRGGGGGDSKNPLATIAMIAIMVGASYFFGPAGAGLTGWQYTAAVATTSVVGGLVINRIFPPPQPKLRENNVDSSPTYSLAGGSNQIRRFQPYPKIAGTHRVFPDLGAQPYTEFDGEDQILFQVFDFGYNDVALSDFKIGATPLSDFNGVWLEVSGTDGKLTLFPSNVDTAVGGELKNSIGWVQRTSSPDVTALAVEITGALFTQDATTGDIVANTSVLEMQYRAVGASTWIPLDFTDDVTTQSLDGVPTDGWFGTVFKRHLEYVISLGQPAGHLLISNSSIKPLRRTYYFNVSKGQYEVRIRKVNLDEAPGSKGTAELFWSQLRSYQPDTGNYLGRKRVALKIRASGQLQGTVDQFNCIARARAVPPDFVSIGADDAPSLAFKFVNGTLAPIVGNASIVFTRAGATATRINASGLLETVAADVPRFNYDPATKALRGLLIEEVRANLCLQSNAFGTSPWVGHSGGLPAMAQDVIGIDGMVSAWTLTDSDAAAYRGVGQSFTVADDSLSHVFTVYVKKTTAATNTFGVNVSLTGGTSVNQNARLNTNSGVATSGVVEDFGDFWRLHVVITNNTTGNTTLTCAIYPATGTNSGSNPGSDVAATVGSAVVTCAQLEKAVFATSYIPTTTSAVTRNAESAIVSDVSTFYNQSEGTLYAEFIPALGVGPLNNPRIVEFNDGTANERVMFFHNDGFASRFQITDGGASLTVSPGTLTPGALSRMAGSYALNDFDASTNGSAVASNSSTLPTITQLWLGDGLGGTKLNGHLRVFAYYPKKLVNAHLPVLSVSGPISCAREYTSNPAWWYADAARGHFVNGRRVWGGGMDESRIDLENLQAFSDWCVDEGLSFNAIFDQQLSVFDMLAQIALMGRGTPSWSTGKLGVVWDAPDQPVVAVFGMHNIVAGSFEVEYSTEELADVLEIDFINPELDWQRDFVRVTVPGATEMARVRRVQLFGCTKKSLAAEHGNLYAAQNAYRTRRYKWRSDWEGMPAARGDVVQLSHDLASLDYSGRLIEGGNSTTLKLPKKVPLYSSGAFVVIVKPDGSFGTYAVAGGAGDTDTLTVTGALDFDPWSDPDHPPYDYRWLYGPTATPGKKVKIDSFKPVSEREVEISAIDEIPEYYESKTNPFAYTPPRPVLGSVSLTSIDVAVDGVRAGTGYLAKVLVSWEVAGDYRSADITAFVGGSVTPVFSMSNVLARSVEFLIQDQQDLTIDVTAWSSVGRLAQSSRLSKTIFVDFASLHLPPDVIDFTLDGNTFNWTAVSAADLAGYKIRYHYGNNRTFTDAHELHPGYVSYAPATFEELPLGTVTFFLTAVDHAGNESANPAIIVKDLGDPTLENIVETYDYEANNFPGSLTGGSLSAGDLLATDTTDFYGPDESAFYGDDAGDFYEDSVWQTMVYETAPVTFPAKWVGSPLTLLHELEGSNISIEWRYSANDASFYDADADPFYGADFDLFYGVEAEWKTWPGAIVFTGEEVQFRITTGGGAVRGAVRELSLVIDVPDIIELFPNFSIGVGGSRPTLTSGMSVIKTIKATLEDVGGTTAVDIKFADKSVSPGPLIIARNSAGTSVTGQADVEIRGHA